MISISNRMTLCDEDFDLTRAQKEDVHFAFVIELPFRFRIKSPHHFHIAVQSGEYDLWMLNRTEVLSPEVSLQAMPRAENLWSTVAVIANKAIITAKELTSIHTCDGNLEAIHPESIDKYRFPAMQALNAFIVGYHMATGELFGGQPLQALTVYEYMNCLRWTLTLIGIPLTHWNDQTIHKLFDLQPARGLRISSAIIGSLMDLPHERLAGIGKAIARLDSFYFYELALEAKTKMIATDYVGALLMAVAALEGVHGAFVTQALVS